MGICAQADALRDVQVVVKWRLANVRVIPVAETVTMAPFAAHLVNTVATVLQCVPVIAKAALQTPCAPNVKPGTMG